MAHRSGNRSPFRPVSLAIEPLEQRQLLDGAGSSVLQNLTSEEYRADRILVRFKPLIQTNYSTLASAGTSVQGSLGLVSGLTEVALHPGTSIATALDAYAARSDVEYTQPDYYVQLQRLPNDPGFNQQWGLNNALNNSASISAPTAWDRTTGSGSTIVAVIDTGVDYTHPDLAANMWRNTREVAGNGVDDDRNGFVDDIHGYNFSDNNGNPKDENGHGTHVAGIIGASGNNGVGVTGVNWNVRIMALRFMDYGGRGSTSNALRALNYAVANGATVSNNSWTSPVADLALEQGIQAAGRAGHIYVVAAGNQGRNIDVLPTYPANYSKLGNVITVAGTDSGDRIAGWSNYGSGAVQIAAPGSGIYSTLPNNRYGTMSGTSMATPFVAGAVALVKDLNPSWTAQEVIQRVLSTVDPLSSLQGKVSTGGRLNLARAVGQGPGVPPKQNTGAKVISVAAMDAGSGLNAIRISFDQPINTSSFTTADVQALTNSQGQALSPTSVTAVSGSANTQFDVTFNSQTAAGNYGLRLSTDILTMAGIALDQNANGTAGENPGDQYSGSVAYAGNNSSSGTGLPAAIKDKAANSYGLNFGGAGTVQNLRVSITLTHGWVSDLTIKLRSPQGTEVLLANRRGGGGKGYKSTVFSDAAASSITTAGAPFTGTFRPEAPLSAFNGQQSQGTWQLLITDNVTGDGGTLQSFSITMDGQASFVVEPKPAGLLRSLLFATKSDVTMVQGEVAVPPSSGMKPQVTQPTPTLQKQVQSLTLPSLGRKLQANTLMEAIRLEGRLKKSI